MMDTFFEELKLGETDVDGALARLTNDKELYFKLLSAFPKDETMPQLETAVAKGNWDNAFTAAHALKGLAGNLGFVPLFHSLSELVITIRAGRLNDLSLMINRVKNDYSDIVRIIIENTKSA